MIADADELTTEQKLEHGAYVDGSGHVAVVTPREDGGVRVAILTPGSTSNQILQDMRFVEVDGSVEDGLKAVFGCPDARMWCKRVEVAMAEIRCAYDAKDLIREIGTERIGQMAKVIRDSLG